MHGNLNTYRLNNYKINGPSGATIRKIQSGIVTTLTSVFTVSINPVDINSTIVFFDAETPIDNDMKYSNFTNVLSPTNIQFTRIDSTTNSALITYQVIEFDGYKSKQVISGISISTSADVTINAVNINKSIVFLDFTCTATNTTHAIARQPNYYLSSSTNLKIIFTSNLPRIASAQILEFN